jgi:hypothetical protein
VNNNCECNSKFDLGHHKWIVFVEEKPEDRVIDGSRTQGYFSQKFLTSGLDLFFSLSGTDITSGNVLLFFFEVELSKFFDKIRITLFVFVGSIFEEFDNFLSFFLKIRFFLL